MKALLPQITLIIFSLCFVLLSFLLRKNNKTIISILETVATLQEDINEIYLRLNLIKTGSNTHNLQETYKKDDLSRIKSDLRVITNKMTRMSHGIDKSKKNIKTLFTKLNVIEKELTK